MRRVGLNDYYQISQSSVKSEVTKYERPSYIKLSIIDNGIVFEDNLEDILYKEKMNYHKRVVVVYHDVEEHKFLYEEKEILSESAVSIYKY